MAIDVDKFLKIETNQFDRDIFTKIYACELNLFYKIDKFKNSYDLHELRSSLEKRKKLFRDIEFSDDGSSFRRVKAHDETYEEAFDKELELARNMYFVHEWMDELEVKMNNDLVLQAEIEKSKPQYLKFKKNHQK